MAALPLSAAAVVAAPLGSATICALRKIHSTAAMISSSSTVTTRSTNCWTCAKVRSPGRTGIRPSATVVGLRRASPDDPASTDAFIFAAPAGSTPITFTSGRDCLMAAATPAASPPPPIGHEHGGDVRALLEDLEPAVPWPAMIHS